MRWLLQPETSTPQSHVGLAQCDLLHAGGAHITLTRNRLTRQIYNRLTFLPVEDAPACAVVIGDSWADHVDMGFPCWPTLLGRSLGYSVLNTARGGSEVDETMEQLARAHEWLDAHEGAAPAQLLIIHTGGNDLLHSLCMPHTFALLASDIWNVIRSTPPPASFSLVRRIARRVAQGLCEVLADAAARGHTTALISAVPICSEVPLARAVVQLLSLGLASPVFITRVLDALGELLNSEIRAALQEQLFSAREGKDPLSLRVIFFDEAAHVTSLAAAAGASTHGVIEVPGLLLNRRFHAVPPQPLSPDAAASSASGDASEADGRLLEGTLQVDEVWLDAHHPSAKLHRALVLPAISALQGGGITEDALH